MAGEWREVTVAELASAVENAIASGPFGSAISSRFFRDTGVPVIRGSNLTDTVTERLVEDGLVFVSQAKAQELARSVARLGDLVFTCWGTVGQVGIIDGRSRYREYIVSNKQMKFTPNSEVADSLFLYYVFSGPEVLGRIRAQAIGSSVPGFNLGQLKALRLRLPPLSEQQAIARTLGALDDKIDLNRKMNATLEEMARALFKSWFVDFDPVRAKAEGRQPSGMDAETAKLFPSEFVESELGPIPKGWGIGSIEDVAKLRREPVRPQEVPSGSVYVGLEHLPRGRIFLEESGTPEALESAKNRFFQGDVLFGKLRPYFKKVAIAPCEGICSTDVLVLAPGENSSAFVTLLAASEPFLEHAVALSDGTRMPRTSWEQLTRFRAVIPPNELLGALEVQWRPVLQRAMKTRSESNSLAQIRDELLPRLLSGELSASVADRIAEGAA